MKKIGIFFSIIIGGGLFVLNNTFVFAQVRDSSGREGMIIALLDKLEREEAIKADFAKAQEIANLETEMSQPGKFKFRDFSRRLHPYLEIETAYNNNIFFIPTKKRDVVTTYTPGLKFSFLQEGNLLGRNALALDLGAKLISYSRYSSLNSQNPYVSILWNRSFNRYHLDFNEKFKKDVELNSDIISGLEGDTDYKANDFNFVYGAEYNRLSFDVGVRRYDYFYGGDYKREDSYNENIFSITGYTKLAPKTKLLFEYDHGIILYPEKPAPPSKNCFYDQAWFGLKGDITDKITGIMKAGYQYRSYRARADWDKPVVGIDLDYQFKERTSFNLKVEKSADQSIALDQNYYDFIRMDLGLANRFAFNPKLSLDINGYYEYDDYPSPARKDKLYGVTWSFKYDLKRWLYAALGYTYQARASDIDSDNYMSHIISLKLRSAF